METKRKSAKVVVSLLALAGLAVFSLFAVGGSLEPTAPPGPTMKTLDEVEPRIPISQADIPLTISTPGSYYLTEDVTAAGTAIIVAVDDVTIDLAGFALVGPDSGTNYGIYMNGRSNVEIRNGTIRDFGYPAIYESSSIYSSSHRAVNIRALSNGYGIYLFGYGHLIKDCTAAENGSNGIYAGKDCTVTGNTAYDNGFTGIGAGGGCTVTGNTCYDNGDDGISTSDGCTVTGNTCCDNGDDGIYAGSGSTVTGNTAYNNDGTGISADSGCTVTGNTCYSNVGYGIYASGYCLVDQNTAYGNSTNMSTGVGCVLGVNCAP